MDMKVPESMSPMEIIAARKTEILSKLKNGEVEPAFQLGGNAYTMNEWEQLLKRIDLSTQEEEMEEEEVMDPYTDVAPAETDSSEDELASIYERMLAVNNGVKQTLRILDTWVGASAS